MPGATAGAALTVPEGRGFATRAPAPWAADDPGDSLYRAARQLLNRSRYAEAARLFNDLIRRYPRSTYAPDAYYWAAFALYRTGEEANLRLATTLLESQASHYPRAATRGDGDALLARVYGELAQRGDPHAGEWVQAHASPGGGRDSTHVAGSACTNDDDDPRIAALNALMQMDAVNAVPVLKQVLARRDTCSVELRRKAVFVLSQKRTTETEDLLLSVARSDPDGDVREQAVFWLSQVGSERAVAALDSILRSSGDEDLRDKAVFALSQIHGARTGQILRDYAAREDAPEETREKAVFWLGQQHEDDNAAFLRDLYARVTPVDLKEKILFSLSQMHSSENTRWLMDLAVNTREDMELRKKALFWAGQTGADIGELVGLYDRTSDPELKDQLIFVYSQRHEPQALDKIIDIARHETNPDLRKKALFWLGQSHDPRAAQVLLGGHQPVTRALAVLVAALGAAAPAAAQSLAQRIARAPDGTVHLTYAARAGVCGNGAGTISFDCAGGGCGRRRVNSGSDWEDDGACPCEAGPVRLALEVSGGRVTRLRAYVGGHWRAGSVATDLGTVPAAEAAHWLLDEARRGDAPAAHDAVFPATLADSVTVWPDLVRLARDQAATRKVREQAVFWLGQAAGEAAVKDLAAMVGDDSLDRDVREHAVFALSQQPREVGVPALIQVARTNRDPEVRRKAFFWLGQTNDPRALALFEEVLTRP